jgi:hypothetical protein
MGEAQEPDPWATAYRSYAGWVPNVRSHLSFSMIGAAKRAHTFTAPYRARPSRVVMVHQHRIVNDYPLPNCLATRLHPDISLHWLLNAETTSTIIPIIEVGVLKPERDRQGLLRGTLSLLPHMHDKGARKRQNHSLKGIGDLLGVNSFDSGQGVTAEAFDQKVDAHRKKIFDLIVDSGPSIELQFALMRTGECRIWYESPIADVEETTLHSVASQAYYFVKDIVHDHTHHDATSDQITPLHPFGRSLGEEDHDDEVAWRRETQWSLSREIERLNREGGLTDLRKSLGIIAYAEAFQASLLSHVRTSANVSRQGEATADDMPPDGTGVPAEAGAATLGAVPADVELQRFKLSTSVHNYDFKHLKDSIRASIDVTATRRAQTIQLAIAAFTTWIATTALVSSLVSAHNSSVPQTAPGAETLKVTLGGLDQWLPWLAACPPLTGVGVSVVLLMILSLFLVDGRAGIYNNTQRVFSQFGRAIAVYLSGSSMLAQWLLLLAYYVALIAAAAVITCGLFVILIGGALPWE